MPDKKPRVRKKTTPKAARATGGQQPTLLALFGKQPAAPEPVLDISSDADGDDNSEADSAVDVVGSSPPPPPPQRAKGKGKRARQPEPEPSPASTALSSLPSTPPHATPPLRPESSFTGTDVYSALRRSRRSQSVGLPDKDAIKPLGSRNLFAAVRKSRSRPILDYTPNGSEERLPGSQDAPIEILEEDTEPAVPLTKAVVHAFFQPRKERVYGKKEGVKGEEKKTVDLTLAETFGGKCKVGKMRRDGNGLDAPWPDAENMHIVVGGDEQLVVRDCRVPRRTKSPVVTLVSVSDERTRRWAKSYRERMQGDVLELSTGSFDAQGRLRQTESIPEETIPEQHLEHPAIARLLGPGGAQYAFAPPARACEILGNEALTEDLAKWLKELELRRSKGEEIPIPVKGRPRERKVIVTQVDRRKRRRVEDQNEYDSEIVVDDDCIDPDDFELTRELGNTFAITGPPGTGKSAAVYACAQELGWSVFEVYAGIGRRGAGTNGLASLIGSVGANHTVGSSGDGEVQQSLILLDEVDLIFEPDTQFWPTIVGLVRESRRPVVIVANDLDCIPREDLPIHQYVEFQAADSELAGSYLYAQAQAAGCAHITSRARLKELFKATVSAPRVPDFAVPDMPQHPLPSQLDRSPDLRRVLEDMKFWLAHHVQAERTYVKGVPEDVREAWAACGKDVVESVGDWSAGEVVHSGESEAKNGLARLWQFAESMSEVDAGLERRWTRQMQAEEVDRFMPSDDDEVRANQLCKPWAPYEQVGIAEFCWDAEIALEAICQARRVLERSGVGEYIRKGLMDRRGWDSRRLEEIRAEHQEKLADFLDLGELVSASTPLLPRPALILDVIPAIRSMVAADDMMAGLVAVRETEFVT
ncbi:AAA family ATPase [Ceratobasidium sp. AG-Ba]|nr:AAA family ATPase [Ceratobasidium sp. AG-Ba]